MKIVELSLSLEEADNKEALLREAAKASGVRPGDLELARMVKRSLDARGKKIVYRCRVEVWLKGETVFEPQKELQNYPDVSHARPVVVVGAGPAGLFAAFALLSSGYKPVILEQGKDVGARKIDVARLNREQVLDPHSNYCFGEGGAGTFSDGKLFTRSTKRGDVGDVLRLLVEHGADPSILIDAHPHIGSDCLPRIVENMRQTLLSHGAEVHFGVYVTDFVVQNGRVTAVSDMQGNRYEGAAVILATGHSARNIYRLFAERGWAMEAKGFALGVRVEHPQALINRIQYGGKNNPLLPPATYSLVSQEQERGVFSFCMCPGGVIVPAVTQPGELVLNGMSNSDRNGKRSNAGVVVAVNPGDIPSYEKYGVLAQLTFQQEVEAAMYAVSGALLRAPAQRMGDFVRSRLSSDLAGTSYHPGVISSPLHELLPSFVAKRLQSAFISFDRKMKGYYTQEALLLGVESRTSAPVCLLRDPHTFEHVQLRGLYPCGEGAGYAGGIVSSALDGMNASKAFISTLG